MASDSKLKFLKESGWFWLVGLLAGAFSAGFGTFPALLALLGQSYLPTSRLDDLNRNAGALKAQQEILAKTEFERDAAKQALMTSQSELSRVQKELQYLKVSAEPFTLIGTGTVTTNEVSLRPVNRERRVTIEAQAESIADVPGGWMQLIVSGTSSKCQSGDVYRNQPTPEVLRASVVCEDIIPAGEVRTYVASAPNKLAQGKSVVLKVMG